MAQKKRYQIGMKQRAKRKKARQKLASKGEDLKEYFYNGFYIKMEKN